MTDRVCRCGRPQPCPLDALGLPWCIRCGGHHAHEAALCPARTPRRVISRLAATILRRLTPVRNP